MPAPPVSKSQLDKLGDRLRDSGEADAADLDLLEEVLTGYHGALQVIIGRLRELGCDPTHRLKTTSTIIGKLRRDRSSSLKSVHDLAGARVIVAGDLDLQDAEVRRFCATSPETERAPVVIDRRSDPRAGYRAVHVIVRVDGIPVEVQFRTDLQDSWAQLFETLADRWGRQIRYGGSLTIDPVRPEIADAKSEIVAEMMQLSTVMAKYEELLCSDLARRAEAERDRPESDPPAEPHAVRSLYLAFREARDRAGAEIRNRQDDVAERLNQMGRVK